MSNEPPWGIDGCPRWSDSYEGRHKDIAYIVPQWGSRTVGIHMGAVQIRDDGQWDWRRHGAFFYEWTSGEGVEPSMEQAMAKVLEGWD
jgi:hypothetical protein